MDLEPQPLDEDRNEIQQLERQSSPDKLEKNRLDVPVPFDEATVLFHKADTFHDGIHPGDDELRRMIFNPPKEVLDESDLSWITPPDGFQAQKGHSPKTHPGLEHIMHQGLHPWKAFHFRALIIFERCLRVPTARLVPRIP